MNKNNRTFIKVLMLFLACIVIWFFCKTLYYDFSEEMGMKAGRGLRDFSISFIPNSVEVVANSSSLNKFDNEYLQTSRKLNDEIIFLKDLNGLRSQDLIRKDGLVVGYVKIIGLDYAREKPHVVLLKFKDKNFQLSKEVEFYVSSLGLENVKYLEIIENHSKTIP